VGWSLLFPSDLVLVIGHWLGPSKNILAGDEVVNLLVGPAHCVCLHVVRRQIGDGLEGGAGLRPVRVCCVAHLVGGCPVILVGVAIVDPRDGPAHAVGVRTGFAGAAAVGHAGSVVAHLGGGAVVQVVFGALWAHLVTPAGCGGVTQGEVRTQQGVRVGMVYVTGFPAGSQ
jgi:hypothetical protein